jgi:hypothetical protein
MAGGFCPIAKITAGKAAKYLAFSVFTRITMFSHSCEITTFLFSFNKVVKRNNGRTSRPKNKPHMNYNPGRLMNMR